MTRIIPEGSRRPVIACLAMALALVSFAVPASAQPRHDERGNQWHGNPHQHPGWDNGYYNRPPVIYGSPYRYGYGYPPPVIYNPGIGIYLPGVSIGIH